MVVEISMGVYANKRFKKLFSSNNIIDVSVDLGLILFDVLSSPILIVVRLVRYIFNKLSMNNYFVKLFGIIYCRKYFLSFFLFSISKN